MVSTFTAIPSNSLHPAFRGVGWEMVPALEEVFGAGGWLYHETRGERGMDKLPILIYSCHPRLAAPATVGGTGGIRGVLSHGCH